MKEELETRDLTTDVRGIQVLCAALMAGMLSFAVVALMLAKVGRGQPGADLLVPAILTGFSMLSLVPTQFVALMQSKQRPAGEVTIDSLVSAYRGSSLISWAGFEGAAFANLVGYLLAGQWWSFIIPGLALIYMAATFPTKDKLTNWLRQRHEQLEIEGL